MEFISDTYIHYGHRCFVPELFEEIKNKPSMCKPHGGLWASPVNAEFGWKDWCKENGYFVKNMGESFKFRLRYDAEVLHLRKFSDVKAMPKLKSGQPASWYCPDFEKMLADGIDAIELHISDDQKLYDALYGWDCDSILVMNPSVIELV